MSDLTPDPRNVISFDDGQASTEGWGLFMLDTADGYGKRTCAIQANDEDGIFRDDFQAAAFVLNSAMDGSAYHRDALSLHLGCELRAGFEAVMIPADDDLSGGDPGYRLISKDGHVILTLEAGDDIIERKAAFDTIADAEAYLNISTTIDPVDLAEGRYCIAAPHGLGDDDEAIPLALELGFEVFYSMGVARWTKGRHRDDMKGWSRAYNNTVAAAFAALSTVEP